MQAGRDFAAGMACRARPDPHARLKERLINLSGAHHRYGDRMLHAKLLREGFRVSVEVVARIYREERLAAPHEAQEDPARRA